MADKFEEYTQAYDILNLTKQRVINQKRRVAEYEAAGNEAEAASWREILAKTEAQRDQEQAQVDALREEVYKPQSKTKVQSQQPVDPPPQPAQPSSNTEPPPETQQRISEGPLRVEVFGGAGYEEKSLPAVEVVADREYEIQQKVIINPLHYFASYTYSLSLALLEPQDYNDVVSKGKYTPKNVLIAGAGRHGEDFKRNDFFQEDFYWDNLKIRTVVGKTFQNKNSNLVNLSFTIIEPVGFTLLNRMVAMSKQKGIRDWSRAPYMLQIDFYSSDPPKPGLIPGLTKYLPISFVTMKTKISTRGTEYAIEAVPFNQNAITEVMAQAPTSFSIKGENVIDFLGVGASKPISLAPQTDVPEIQPAKPGQKFLSSGFVDAVNKFYLDQVALGKMQYAHEYRVIMDKEIGESPTYQNNKNSIPVVNNTRDSKKASIQSSVGKEYTAISFEGNEFKIPTKTRIDNVIEDLIINSEYYRTQVVPYQVSVKDIKSDKDKTNPISSNSFKGFKIIPIVKIKNFDTKINSYIYEVEYHVKKWLQHNSHPASELAGQIPGVVKDYQYIYTGKNNDILELSLDFNMLYFNESTILNTTNFMAGGDNKERGLATENMADTNASKAIKSGETTNPSSLTQVIPVRYIQGDAEAPGADGKSAATMDAHRARQMDSRGDMIKVRLRIVGDPTFIKQDNIFDNVGIYQTVPVSNGSLAMDGHELYVHLTFLSPTDYSEQTGLADPTKGPYSYVPFSGKYSIVDIENVFANGKFEQTLNLVRLPIQEAEALALQKSPGGQETNTLPEIRSKVGASFTI